MTTIALIPARAGSKRLRGKNFRELCGLMLWQWAALAAHKSKCFDRIVLATDAGYSVEDGARWVVPGLDVMADMPLLSVYRRKPASDTQGLSQLVREWTEAPHADAWFVGSAKPTWPNKQWARLAILQPTSPTRTATDIRLAMRWLDEDPAADTVLTTGPDNITNGAVYACTRAHWERTGSYLGGKTRVVTLSADSSVDVDTAEDWAAAEAVLRGRGHG